MSLSLVSTSNVDKIKMMRESRDPVLIGDLEAFRSEWVLIFDKIQKRVAEITADDKNRLYMKPAHVLSERMCRYADRLLFRKHGLEVFEDLPQTLEEWTFLIQKYQDCPIMLAMRADGKGLVAIIMDEFGR